MHAGDLRTWEVEAGGYWDGDQPRLQSEFEASYAVCDPASKPKPKQIKRLKMLLLHHKIKGHVMLKKINIRLETICVYVIDRG